MNAIRVSILTGISLLLLLAIPGCTTNPVIGQDCGGHTIYLYTTGEFVDIDNPCGQGWVAGDYFDVSLRPDQSGLALRVNTILGPNGNVRRQLFRAPDWQGQWVMADVQFRYFRQYQNNPDDTNVSTGTYLVTTVPPLQVSAAATPAAIAAGQSSQLQATATLGAPPYTFNWTSQYPCVTAAMCMDHPAIANPVAKPDVTNVFTVTVTDSVLPQGQTAVATVTVTVSASPQFNLTVINSAFSQRGAVSSSPPGINSCSGTCMASYPAGTRVILKPDDAKPITWIGCDDVTSVSCFVILKADRTVTIPPQ